MSEEAAVLLLCLLHHSTREAEGTATGLVLHSGFALLLFFGLTHCSLQIQSKDSLPLVEPCAVLTQHRREEVRCFF